MGMGINITELRRKTVKRGQLCTQAKPSCTILAKDVFLKNAAAMVALDDRLSTMPTAQSRSMGDTIVPAEPTTKLSFEAKRSKLERLVGRSVNQGDERWQRY